MTAFSKPTFLVATLLLLSGCQTSPQSANLIKVSPDLRAPPNRALKIAAVQQKISGEISKVSIDKLVTSQQNGLLLVQAEFSNKKGSKQLIDYRLRWLNSSGIQISNYGPWQVFSIEPRQKTILQVIAPTLEIADFVLEFKRHD